MNVSTAGCRMGARTLPVSPVVAPARARPRPRFGVLAVIILLAVRAGPAAPLDWATTLFGNSPTEAAAQLRGRIRVAAGAHLQAFRPPVRLEVPRYLSALLRNGVEAFLPHASDVSPAAPAAIYPPLQAVSEIASGPSELLRPLTIIDANLWLLPPPAADGQERRMADFARFVRDWRPDLVTLQEVWLPSYVATLRRALPDYYCIVKPFGLYNQTGLVIFSRHPPLEAWFAQYGLTHHHNLVELAARKGFLRAAIRAPIGIVTVIDTHLYAHASPQELELTRRQCESVVAAAALGTPPVILAGDLNLRVGDVSPRVLGILCMEDNLEASTVSKNPGKKIDYLMLRPPPGMLGQVESKVLRDPVVSDHCPILATLTIGLPPGR